MISCNSSILHKLIGFRFNFTEVKVKKGPGHLQSNVNDHSLQTVTFIILDLLVLLSNSTFTSVIIVAMS